MHTPPIKNDGSLAAIGLHPQVEVAYLELPNIDFVCSTWWVMRMLMFVSFGGDSDLSATVRWWYQTCCGYWDNSILRIPEDNRVTSRRRVIYLGIMEIAKANRRALS